MENKITRGKYINALTDFKMKLEDTEVCCDYLEGKVDESAIESIGDGLDIDFGWDTVTKKFLLIESNEIEEERKYRLLYNLSKESFHFYVAYKNWNKYFRIDGKSYEHINVKYQFEELQKYLGKEKGVIIAFTIFGGMAESKIFAEFQEVFTELDEETIILAIDTLITSTTANLINKKVSSLKDKWIIPAAFLYLRDESKFLKYKEKIEERILEVYTSNDSCFYSHIFNSCAYLLCDKSEAARKFFAYRFENSVTTDSSNWNIEAILKYCYMYNMNNVYKLEKMDNIFELLGIERIKYLTIIAKIIAEKLTNKWEDSECKNILLEEYRNYSEDYLVAVKNCDTNLGFILLEESKCNTERIELLKKEKAADALASFFKEIYGLMGTSEIKGYFEGRNNLEEIYNFVEELKNAPEKNRYNNNKYDYLMKKIIEKESYEEYLFKLVSLLFKTENKCIADYYRKYWRNDYAIVEHILNTFEKREKDITKIILFTENCFVEGFKDFEKMKIRFEECVKKYEGVVVTLVNKLTSEGKLSAFETVFNEFGEKYIECYIKFIGETSKNVREKITEKLGGYEPILKVIDTAIADKKLGVREHAIDILSKFDKAKVASILEKALEREKNVKLKVVIEKLVDEITESTETKTHLDISEYCREGLKKNKKGANMFDIEVTSEIRELGSDKIVSKDVIKYIIACYASENGIKHNAEAKKISDSLNKKDLANVAYELLMQWMESYSEAKKKYVMALAAEHGDHRVVEELKKAVEEWPQKSRGAIATDGIFALALNGGNEALMYVDNVSRKFKFRQVKDAAKEALDFAAKELGITAEELADRIVPDLGFDKRGERVFDFGARKFTARLNSTFGIDISDDSGKTVKVLPKPNKSDDETKASEATEEFKKMKKLLKSVIDSQTNRLEYSILASRRWAKSAWTKLFVENPLMHQFAIGLVWGEYRENKLVNSFRYMEDGSFCTKDEESFEIEEDSFVGIAHPIEFSDEDLSQWKQQLEDYEIVQPIEQLKRKVFTFKESELNDSEVERFNGTKINGRSLYGKLSKFGWYRGSVQDGGWYYSYFKEIPELDVGIELHHSGCGIVFEGEEEVTIEKVLFYKAGTVSRGSYMYDEVRRENLVKLGEMPVSFVSEVVYELERSLMGKAKEEEENNERI